MQRLDETSALAAAAQSGAVVLLFGHPTGRVTAIQAQTFAALWADHASEARFGYVDAAAHPALREAFVIRALPTVLVLRDGDLIDSFEGYCPRARIAAALHRRPSAEPATRIPKPQPCVPAHPRAERVS